MDGWIHRDRHIDRRIDIFTYTTCSGTPLTGFPPSILKFSTAASTSTHSSPMNAAALSCSNPDTFTCIRRVRVRVCNIYTYIETYIHAHIHACMLAQIRPSIYAYTYIRTNTHTHIHACTHPYVQAYKHAHIHAYARLMCMRRGSVTCHWSLFTGNYTCTRRGSIGTSGVLLRPASSSPIT